MRDTLSRQVHQPRAVILREGERGDCAYLIESGRVEVSALRSGRPVRLAVLGKNDFFGEMALVDQPVRSATVTALEETRVVVIDGDRFRDEIERAQPLMQMFVRVLVERLRTTDGRFLGGKARSPDSTGEGSLIGREATLQSTELAVSALRLEHDLRQAVTERQLEMHYQPIVGLESGAVVGFEALMRWRRGDHLVGPGDFIGLAESSGLIVPMGTFALEQSCAALRRLSGLRSCGSPPLFMGINVSPRQLVAPTFVDQLRTTLAESGVEPAQIHLEITESLLMDDPEHAVSTLDRIKALGVELSIDDFGTGYSSLSYLSRFPIDTLKIDRSFVTAMGSDPAARQIVRAIARLAQSLEMSIVAEGIEEEPQRDFLRQLGCQNGQGFLFSRPLAERELTDRLGPPQPSSRGRSIDSDGT